MVLPSSGDIDEVDIIAVTELLPGILAAAVLGGCRQACLLEVLLALGHALGMEVAERLDLDAIEMREALDSTWAAHSEADEAYTHHGHGGMAQPQDVLLPSGTLRHDRLDDVCLGVFLQLHGTAGADRERHRRRKRHDGEQLSCLHERRVLVNITCWMGIKRQRLRTPR